jgi:CIC family chloride channel protein
MGAVFAGSARAPITAVLIVFELTGEYSVILPLMTAVVLATGLSHLLTRDSVYTAKLSRRGIDLDAPEPAWGRRTPVTEVLVPVGPVLSPEDDLTAARAALPGGSGVLALADGNGRYLGVVTARAVLDQVTEEGATAGPGPGPRLRDLVEARPTVAVSATVAEGLALLDRHDLDAVPVVDDGGAVRGWFTDRAVLAALRRDLPDGTPSTGARLEVG